MKNYKIENNLVGDEKWPNIPFVAVKGISKERSASGIDDVVERENVIQSWKNIAVMKATSDKPTKFYIGFLKGDLCQYLKHEFTTDMEFGMRISPEDTNFIAFPLNFEDKIQLELIDQTTENDPKYQDLILI